MTHGHNCDIPLKNCEASRDASSPFSLLSTGKSRVPHPQRAGWSLPRMLAVNGLRLLSISQFSAVSEYSILFDMHHEISVCIECECKDGMVIWGLGLSRLNAFRMRTLSDQ